MPNPTVHTREKENADREPLGDGVPVGFLRRWFPPGSEIDSPAAEFDEAAAVALAKREDLSL